MLWRLAAFAGATTSSVERDFSDYDTFLQLEFAEIE